MVDDNHINRLFFESSLKKHALLVTTADSGFQAVTLCQSQSFDLILMDIRMNGMDGIQTAAQIKQIPHCQSIPILAVSAEAFDHSKQADFADSMLKPINQENLAAVINKYLTLAPCFDQQQALQISHNDTAIVARLRQLFIAQLPADLAAIKQHHQNQQIEQLEAQLHKTLGAAKVCAASLLIEKIEQLKKLAFDTTEFSAAYQDLLTAIELTIHCKA